MPRDAPPPITEIPAKEWREPAVLHACRTRDANALLRLAHRYGVNNERLAYWTGIYPNEISRRLNGKQIGPVEKLERWERIAEALAMPDHARHALGLAPKATDILTPATAGRGEALQLGDAATNGALVDRPPQNLSGEEVNRREAMKLMAATAASALPLVGYEPLRAVLASPESAHPLDHLRRMREMLAESDNLYGPSRVIPAAREQVALILELKSQARGSDLSPLLSVGAEYADLIGWLHQDSGQHQVAAWWLDRALEWSHLSMDDQATSFMLTRKSQLASDEGDGNGAVYAASAAARHANTRVAAIAATQSIRGYALLGDRKGFQAARHEAHELLARSDGEGLTWGRFFDASYIEVHYAQGQVTLGDYRGAAQTYDAALASVPGEFRRDRGVYLARAAFAHARANNLDRAVRSGVESLAIGLRTRSARILRELRQFDAAIDRFSNEPSVSRFRDAFTSVESSNETWKVGG
jgi:hypothetical protein